MSSESRARAHRRPPKGGARRPRGRRRRRRRGRLPPAARPPHWRARPPVLPAAPRLLPLPAACTDTTCRGDDAVTICMCLHKVSGSAAARCERHTAAGCRPRNASRIASSAAEQDSGHHDQAAHDQAAHGCMAARPGKIRQELAAPSVPQHVLEQLAPVRGERVQSSHGGPAAARRARVRAHCLPLRSRGWSIRVHGKSYVISCSICMRRETRQLPFMLAARANAQQGQRRGPPWGCRPAPGPRHGGPPPASPPAAVAAATPGAQRASGLIAHRLPLRQKDLPLGLWSQMKDQD